MYVATVGQILRWRSLLLRTQGMLYAGLLLPCSARRRDVWRVVPGPVVFLGTRDSRSRHARVPVFRLETLLACITMYVHIGPG